MNSKNIPDHDQIIEIGRRMWQQGMIASNDGNISCRVGDNRFLITASGVSKGFMREEDLIIIDDGGQAVQGKGRPSSELKMHLFIYRHRPDIKAICHAHPPYATAFAVAEIPLDDCVLPEVILTIGSIPLIPYGTTGTEEIYRRLGEYLPDRQAFLLARHGAVTLGTDLMESYYRMETLEHYAHILFIARQMGSVQILNQQELEKLKAHRLPHL